MSLFVWRLLRNQIPTKDNPVRCEIIQPNSNTCGTNKKINSNMYVSGCKTTRSIIISFWDVTFSSAFGS